MLRGQHGYSWDGGGEGVRPSWIRFTETMGGDGAPEPSLGEGSSGVERKKEENEKRGKEGGKKELGDGAGKQAINDLHNNP